MRDFKRSDRVGSSMLRTLSELLLKLKQKPPGMVTLQEVRVSRDLSHAKVFFTVLGADPDVAQTFLNQQAGSLRFALGKVVKLRIVPELHFVFDETPEAGNRLQRMIEAAVASDMPASEHTSDDINKTPASDV
jgi:ribosome-binding factor A